MVRNYNSGKHYRTFHEAAAQLPAEGIKVVFLDVLSKSNIDEFANRVVQESKVRNPRFGNVDFIVLRYRDRNPKTGAFVPVIIIVPLPWHRISREDQRLASILGSGKSI